MPAETAPILTAKDLLQLDVPNKWTELVRGRLVVSEPPGTEHGRISANLGYFVSDFVRRHGLGCVYAQDTGFKIQSDPDTVRAPDLAFVSAARVPMAAEPGYAVLVPDLVVEVVSAGDRRGEVLARVGDWLDAGAGLVWVIDPRRTEAQVHRRDGGITVIGASDALDGEDVLPGFTCLLAEILR